MGMFPSCKIRIYRKYQNDYGYYTAIIQDGKLPKDLSDLPKKSKIKVKGG
jgi:hypothetical protein